MRHSLPDTAGTTKGKVRGDGFPYILETQLNFRVRKGRRGQRWARGLRVALMGRCFTTQVKIHRGTASIK